MTRKPLAIVGFAKRGKTTLVCGIVRELAARGIATAVIKHTHHLLTADDTNSGDTARALDAGAREAILATAGRAVKWRRGEVPLHFDWTSLPELLSQTEADLVLIEGFKREGEWPQIVIARDAGDLESLHSSRTVAVVSDAELDVAVPLFRASQLGALSDFVDTISKQ